jgi:ubiquinone biosynthesis protein COQ9
VVNPKITEALAMLKAMQPVEDFPKDVTWNEDEAKIQMLLEALKKAVSRQGFSNDELIEARAAIAEAEKGATP